MGEVYLALDERLEREVAIKFLPEHLSRDRENVERFKREAKAAAALNHPNIVTIHEIDSYNDQIFIVMEYIAGKTLHEYWKDIASDAFKQNNIADLIRQLCEGLAQAHSAGIVHRDIKPENILIDPDQKVKILDFGLAKLKGSSKLTKESSTLGTINYISPEQIKDTELNATSDIWSLGIILYELLSGELPFKGTYEQAIIYSILNDEPDFSCLPDTWQKIVRKCLEKKPENRYQDVNALKADILNREKSTIFESRISRSSKTLIYGGAGLVLLIIVVGLLWLNPFIAERDIVHTLAILPFMNLKDDKNSDYLGYAFADEIISDLSYLQNLAVRPASSVRKYHRRDTDPLAAGTDLDVQYILTGNYQIESGDIRLHIELVRVDVNEIIWQKEIQENYDNVFRIQDVVTQNVIDGLSIKFSSDERQRMKTDTPANVGAYDYYQLSLVKPTTINGNMEAIALLEKSLAQDSGFAPTYNQLGFRIHQLASYNLKKVPRLQQAESVLLKALELNPDLLGALGNLATIYTEFGHHDAAYRLVQRMLAINPNHAFAHFALGYVYRYTGILDEAVNEMENAVSLDPSDWRFRSLGITYYYCGEFEKALKAFDLDKGSWYALSYQGMILLEQGKFAIAREYLSSSIAIDPESFAADLSRAYQAFIDKDRKHGIRVLRRIEAQNPPDSDMLYLVSCGYARFKDRESVLRTLEMAVNNGFYIPSLLENKSLFDFVRNTTRFKNLLSIANQKHNYYKGMFFN